MALLSPLQNNRTVNVQESCELFSPFANVIGMEFAETYGFKMRGPFRRISFDPSDEPESGQLFFRGEAS